MQLVEILQTKIKITQVKKRELLKDGFLHISNLQIRDH